jgi:uncharacterized protein
VKSVFVDSGAFFALLASGDAMHARAAELFEQADADGWSLVTTNAVLYETYALLLTRSRPGRQNALAFLDMLSADDYRVERVRKGDEDQAVALLRAHTDKAYSLCDALSFVVMERLGIKDVVAFDRHFREIGRFNVL